MKIVVLVKEVPDTYGVRHLNLETGLAERENDDAVLDEVCERAIELALSLQEQHGENEVEIQLVSMGPETAAVALRKGLAMGATSAVHINDANLVGADLGLTSEVLAAVMLRAEPDLIIAGNQSTDGASGVLPSMLGERLNFPTLSNMNTVSISENTVGGNRVTSFGAAQVQTELPAVISITDAFPDGRFPTFKGNMAAKKKHIEVMTLAGLGIVDDPGRASRSIMTEISRRPERAAGIKIIDDGNAAEALVDFLVEQRLI